ncbi:MAG: hypothetical protein HZA50_04690 [Planctomycetes bacterium]|nr:hypothetical protein [Planctomycetota bacterium]
MKIKIGIPASLDGRLMFHALSVKKIAAEGLDIELRPADIETLNDRASRAENELSVVSVGAWPYICPKYAIAGCGATFGDGWGPRIVSREVMEDTDLAAMLFATAGTTTSAFLALQLYRPGLKVMLLPADKVVPAVQTGLVECALLDHETQGISDSGLHCIADLGDWWFRKTGLPLPITCFVVRNDLESQMATLAIKAVRDSIRCAIDNHAAATQAVLDQAGPADRIAAASFLKKSVTDLSADMGETGKKAILTFLSMAAENNLMPPCPIPDFV